MKESIMNVLSALETPHEDFTLTVSIGHFLLQVEDLSAVPYAGENGLESFLAYLVRTGWTPIEDGTVLVGCRRGNEKVELGAGGQVNWLYGPFIDMQDVDKAYLAFIEPMFDELKRRSQVLVATGHQPVTNTADIEVVPAPGNAVLENLIKHDAHMADHLKSSASIEVSMQYAHADNFEKRYQAAMIIQPALAALFDNTAWVDGRENQTLLFNMNNLVQADERLYHVDHVFGQSFKYADYADFLTTAKALYDDMAKDTPQGEAAIQPEALCDFVRPMVSVNQYGLTVSNIDSVPYPLNMAVILMMKALLYNPDHMTALQKVIEEMHEDKLLAARPEVLKAGLAGKMGEGTVFDLIKDLYFMMTLTVSPKEQHYLQPLNSLVFKNVRPYAVGSKQFDKMLGD